MELRLANINDARAIRKIYEPYVENTAVSFEYEVPSVEEFERRISTTLEKYPYLVAIEEGEVVGYAYAGSFHTRRAYQHSAELSIYIKEGYKKKSIGSSLYNKIQEILVKQNVFMVHALIASPEKEDEHLTSDSEKFHLKMGFKLAGKHEKCGYKFGNWYSVIWMDKLICDKPENPDNFIPFSELNYSL